MLRFRAWRRGFREIDLILGGFAEQTLSTLDDEGLSAFERLLDAPDQDVYAWIIGQKTPPPEFATETLDRIRTFRIQVVSSPP